MPTAKPPLPGTCDTRVIRAQVPDAAVERTDAADGLREATVPCPSPRRGGLPFVARRVTALATHVHARAITRRATA